MNLPTPPTNSKTIMLVPKLRKLTVKLLCIATGTWLLALIYLWFWQEALIFHPIKLAPNYVFNLKNTSEIYLDVPDAKIHALYFRQAPEKSKGIVLFLHGNAESLATWFTHIDFWEDTGYDVLMIDYRGFGKSSGHITSEAQLHDDVLRAWNFIAPQYEHKKRIIYGRSLGTGLAAKLATKVSADLLVLVSPYESMVQIAHEYYPWVPDVILRYPLQTDQFLTSVKTKTLLIHGTKDTLISIEHSRRLQQLQTDSHLVEIPGAGHGDIHEFTLYLDTLKKALTSL